MWGVRRTLTSGEHRSARRAASLRFPLSCRTSSTQGLCARTPTAMSSGSPSRPSGVDTRSPGGGDIPVDPKRAPAHRADRSNLRGATERGVHANAEDRATPMASTRPLRLLLLTPRSTGAENWVGMRLAQRLPQPTVFPEAAQASWQTQARTWTPDSVGLSRVIKGPRLFATPIDEPRARRATDAILLLATDRAVSWTCHGGNFSASFCRRFRARKPCLTCTLVVGGGGGNRTRVQGFAGLVEPTSADVHGTNPQVTPGARTSADPTEHPRP